MSFNDIILPNTVIVDIYKNLLVELNGEENKKKIEKTTESADVPKEPLQFLGNNLKRILVFVDYPQEVFLPDEQLEFLGKILSACKLDIGDTAIVNTAKSKTSVSACISQLTPQLILIFGTGSASTECAPEMDFFIPGKFQEADVIYAPPLDQLSSLNQENQKLKGRLWTSLKQVFKM